MTANGAPVSPSNRATIPLMTGLFRRTLPGNTDTILTAERPKLDWWDGIRR